MKRRRLRRGAWRHRAGLTACTHFRVPEPEWIPGAQAQCPHGCDIVLIPVNDQGKLLSGPMVRATLDALATQAHLGLARRERVGTTRLGQRWRLDWGLDWLSFVVGLGGRNRLDQSGVSLDLGPLHLDLLIDRDHPTTRLARRWSSQTRD